MNRGELSALRDAIDVLLNLPDRLRDQVAQWLAPEAYPHPPPRKDVSRETSFSPRRSPTPHAGKARRGRPPTSAKASEQKLIAALQASPGASERALATAVGANRSQTGERLRKLAAAGAVAKGGDGRWRLTADLAGEEARPTQPSPAAS
jgi:hypothetical protein